MADSKITALTALTAADPANDMMPIVDVSDTSMAASGTIKRISINNILACSPSATLASATITGDLTVDTSTLKVDSANNRVGINNASPAQALDVAGSVYLSTNATYLYGKTSGGSATRTFGINASNDVYIGSIDQSISNIRFNSGGGDWMTLNSTGLGVGVTPSAWGSNSKALQVGGGAASVSSTGAGSTASRFAHGAYFDNTNWLYQYTGVGPALYQVTGANAGSTHAWYIAPGGTAGNAITFTQAMTLDASGNLGVGTTNPAAVFGTVRSGFVATGASGAIGAKVDATGRACLIAWNADTAGDNNFVQFFTEATLTSRGSITYNRGAGQVAYNITSDYRLKEDIKPLTGAVNRIASLKPSTYKLKETGSACEGFIAHELAEVVPMAVTGTKDAVDADGKPVYQAVDLSKVTPLLVAAIQELTARVEALEAK